MDLEDLRAWLRENDATIFTQLNRRERWIKLAAVKAATDLVSLRYHHSAGEGQKIRESAGGACANFRSCPGSTLVPGRASHFSCLFASKPPTNGRQSQSLH